LITNVGVIDGVFRCIVGACLLALSYGHFGVHLPHAMAWATWAVGAGVGLTGIFRFCPIYALLGTDSCAIYPAPDKQPPSARALDKGEPSA
jgi:hypothetical protein